MDSTPARLVTLRTPSHEAFPVMADPADAAWVEERGFVTNPVSEEDVPF